MRYFTVLCILLAASFSSCNDFRSPAKVENVQLSKIVNISDSQYVEFENATYNFHNYGSRPDRVITPLVEGLDSAAASNVRDRYYSALSLLNRGYSLEAITIIQDLLKIDDMKDFTVNSRDKQLYELLAISYMRMGEQQNCVINHTASSCIVPIAKEGQHQLPKGSQQAIKLYTHILNKFPNDLQSKWLLNLAYMTLGEHPAEVPDKYLIKESTLNSTASIPKFKDVAGGLGVGVVDNAGGSCIEDFNGDGYLDIMASSWDVEDQIRFFVNNGDGTFSDNTEQAGLIGQLSGLNMIHADYDNDGYQDVLVLRGAWLDNKGEVTNLLLHNNGDGTFTEKGREAGLITKRPTQTAVWADFNLDGWLDLFIGNETRKGNVYPCELYLNNMDGTFTEVAEANGVNYLGMVKGVSAGDINNDGWPDLFISASGTTNKLYLNNGEEQSEGELFMDISKEAGIEMPLFSFPMFMWDFNNDGWEDIFVVTYDFSEIENINMTTVAELVGLPIGSEVSKLYKNNGDGTFTDVAEEVGLNKALFAMGLNFGDINNDGWLDTYAGTGAPDFRSITPNKMYLNGEGVWFDDVTTSGGFGHIQKGHAISFGDLDNDGDQDIYSVMGGAYAGDAFQNVLFENPGNDNHYITIDLQGVTCNRSAIGARIKVDVTDKEGNQRAIYNTVSTGGSFGASSLRQEIGVGNAAVIDRLTITWPDKEMSQQEFENVPINSHLKITQGKENYELIELDKFKFVQASHDHAKHFH